MLLATARRTDSAAKRKGRPGKSSPFQITLNGSDKDKALDWRTQHIATRHLVPNRLAQEIVRAHFGEGLDDE